VLLAVLDRAGVPLDGAPGLFLDGVDISLTELPPLATLTPVGMPVRSA
jgi:hypothetical protein